MAAVAFIVLVHVLMVVLVPRTFPTMFTGRAGGSMNKSFELPRTPGDSGSSGGCS